MSDQDWERQASEESSKAPPAAEQNSQMLNHLLGEIPQASQAAIRRLKMEAKSVKETAAHLRMNEGALRTMVHRAIKALKARVLKRTRSETKE